MRLDGLSLRELAKEIDSRCRGLKVEKVSAAGRHAVFIWLQRAGGILVSSSPQAARAVIQSSPRVEAGADPSSFIMLLRKHLEGGRLLGASRRVLENAIELSFQSWDDERGEAPKMLLLEASGPDSNIFLLDSAGAIIGAMKRAREGRADAPGQQFEPLPRFELPDALECSRQAFIASAARKAAEAADISPAAAISGGLFGLSRDHASDLLKVAGFDGSSHAKAADMAYAALRARQAEFGDEIWPCIEEKAAKGMRASFILAPKGLGGSPSSCLEGILGASEAQEQAGRARAELMRAVSSAESRARNKLDARRADLNEAMRAYTYRIWADAILSSMQELTEPLPDRAILKDYSQESCPELQVPLERQLSAVQNAERYYQRYNRAKRAEKALTGLISAAEAEVGYLEGVRDSIERADDAATFEQLRKELSISGIVATGGGSRQLRGNKKARASKPALPAQYTLSTGHKALVGRNNLQNDQLTFSIASPWDIWLHVKGAAGSHVVVRLERGELLPGKALEEAALLAALNSSQKRGAKVEVDYTEVRKVRKMAGGLPGAVTYTGGRSITVTPLEKSADSPR